MKLLATLLASALCAVPVLEHLEPAANRPVAPQDDEQMAEMWAAAAKYINPGEHHALLAELIGEWDVESRMFMGPQGGPPSAGKAVTRWKIEGRWLESDFDGTLMGMPLRDVQWLGYDNMKQSYVMTRINGFDTAMNHAEGDMTPGGDALILYGTLDEYLTGEHDKMVKYVYRFSGEHEVDAEGNPTAAWKSIDRIVLEVHDLPIGEVNTKVLEFTYTRRKK
ncbi:MAG: DUF1579 family protein [Planctomycetota bacterium]